MRRLWGAFNRSLPARLLLIFVGVGIGMVLILSITFSLGLREQWRTTLQPHLIQYLDYVNADIGSPPDVNRAKELADRLPINIYITGPDLNFSSTGQAIDVAELDFEDRDGRHDRGWKKHWRKGDRGDRARRERWPAHIDVGELDDRTVLRSQLGDYQVFYELTRHGDRPHRHGVFLMALAILGGLLWLCFVLIRRQLKPVQAISQGVGLMGQGDLTHRIGVRRDDDLGDLASSINTMASDIESMLDAKRQLLLGISHELRSPLTRARVSVALLDEDEHRTRILEDLQEMESLITEILESERLNSRHGVLNRAQFDLSELIRSVVNEIHFDEINMTDELSEPVCNFDESRVRLLLRNVLGNAMRYGAQAEQPPTLVIQGLNQRNTAGSGVRILVSDSGPGIAPDDLEQLTEPFYRADPSRSRHTGGFGLGLYLSRLICEAHGGTLEIQSEPGVGTTVTVILR